MLLALDTSQHGGKGSELRRIGWFCNLSCFYENEVIFHSSSLSIKAETVEFNSWRAVINLCRLSCVERINSDRRFWNLKYYYYFSIPRGRVIRNVNEPRVGFSVVDVDRMKRNTKWETGAAQLTRKGARGSNHNIFPLSFIRVAWLNNLRSLVSDRIIYTYLTTAIPWLQSKYSGRGVRRKKSSLEYFLPVISLRFRNQLFNSRSFRWMNYKLLRKARWHIETLFHHIIRSSGNLIYISSRIPASQWLFYLSRQERWYQVGLFVGTNILSPSLQSNAQFPSQSSYRNSSRMTWQRNILLRFQTPRWTLETYSGVPPPHEERHKNISME